MHMTYDPRTNGRQRTSKCWRFIDVEKLMQDPSRGQHYRNDFTQWADLTSAGSSGGATLVQATAGTATISDTREGGWVLLDSNAATENQGPTLFFPSPIVIPGAERLIAFGCRLLVKDIATSGLQFAFGLVLSTLDTTPVTAEAAASGASDYIMFFTTGNTGTVGKVYFAAEDGGTQDISTLDVHTFLDGDTVTDGSEIVKFECRINGLDEIELYVNGVETLHDVGVAAIPEGTALRMVVACLTGDQGTESDSIAELDWVEVASVPY